MRTLAASAALVLCLLLIVPGSAPGAATAGAAASTWCGGAGKIVVLGDSMSTGFGTTGYDTAAGQGYQATTYGWPSRWDSKTGVTLYNLARNGAMASDFLTDGVGGRPGGPFEPGAVSKIKTVQPALVVIGVGGNEYISDRSATAVYEANLKKLASRIKWVAPNARLLFVQLYHFDYRQPDAAPYASTWTDYRRAMKNAAVGQWYLDMHQYMPSTRTNTAGLYHPDEYGPGMAVHATDAGHIAYFSAIWGRVQCR